MVPRAGGNRAVTGGWKAGDAPEATVIPGATEDICWQDPQDRYPWWKATLEMQPGDRQTPPALCNPGHRQPHQHNPEDRQTPPNSV